MQVQKHGFHESYDSESGMVDRIAMKFSVDDRDYRVQCEVDQMGDEAAAIFECIEDRTDGGSGFPTALDTTNVTAIVTAIEFAETFAEQNGYAEFRGPRVGPK